MGLLGLFLIAVTAWLVIGCVALTRHAKRPPGGAAGRALAAGAPIDPSEVGLNWEQWSLRTRDGLDLPVWDITGEGESGVVLLIHDWSEAPLTMLDRAGELVPHVQRIVVPCLRGHDGAAGACSLGPAEQRDVSDLLEVLGEEDVTLEGAGFAGLIAEALRGNAHVCKVCVSEPWSGAGDALRRIARKRGVPAFPIATLVSMFGIAR
jgi:pimeloyl-ACP methyl ester carboxylesterase